MPPMPITSGTNQLLLQTVHGCCMVIAFGLFFPAGIMIPACARHLLPDGRWLTYHKGIQWFAVLLAASGFGVIVVEVGQDHFDGTHAMLGLVLIICTFLQPVLATIRPHPPRDGEVESVLRFIWEKKHKWLGGSMIAIAMVQVFTGVTLAQQNDDFDLHYMIPLFCEHPSVIVHMLLSSCTCVLHVAPNMKTRAHAASCQSRLPHLRSFAIASCLFESPDLVLCLVQSWLHWRDHHGWDSLSIDQNCGTRPKDVPFISHGRSHSQGLFPTP